MKFILILNDSQLGSYLQDDKSDDFDFRNVTIG